MKNKPTFFLPPRGKRDIVILPTWEPQLRLHRVQKPKYAEGDLVYCFCYKRFGRIVRVWPTIPVSYGVRFEDGKIGTVGDDNLKLDVLGEMARL